MRVTYVGVVLAAVGVALLVGGVLLLWNICRRRSAKRVRESDESW